MRSVAESVRRRGGLAATHELLADGHTEAGVRIAWRSGSVRRIRQGWYADPTLHPDILDAVRVGGALTCVSALNLQGFWVLAADALHVEVPATASRLRSRSDHRTRLATLPEHDVRVHWSPTTAARLITDPLVSLEHALSCLSPELAVAAADSVLHAHPGRSDEWRGVVARSGSTDRATLALADGVCESGTETLVWLWLVRERIRAQRQVDLPLVGRVDFLIGDRLVVEVDGRKYHSDDIQFEEDRRRGAALARMGYQVLRFSYFQVMFRFDEVAAAILGVVAGGGHLF